MLSEIDNFYLKQEEPLKSTLITLKQIIFSLDNNITNSLKYKMPFFCYKGKMFCYFWIDKKTKEPYIGLVEGNRINHPLLEKGNRARIKIFRISMHRDIPIDTIKEILNIALNFYREGLIKIKK